MGRERTIGFVGDVFVERESDHLEPFRPVLDVLHAPDLLFGNFEGVLSDDPEYAPSTGIPVFAPTTNVAALAPAGFGVMSLANNHIVDCGHRGMLATRDLIREQGIATAGVGASLTEATTPAILDVDGVRVATVAFASVFPKGYEARGNFPGLAPVRAHTIVTDPTEDVYWIPEGPLVVSSKEVAGDVEILRDTIAAARESADVVIASFHWGDYTRPFVVTGHERRVARIAIDAGADIVAGHHHHALRGFEWYGDKPIMYGLGHFVFDQPTLCARMDELGLSPATDDQPDLDHYGTIARRDGWPYLPLHTDTRLTMMAYVTVGEDGGTDLGFVPCQLQPDGRVEAYGVDDVDGKAVVDYLRRACESESLPVRFQEGREVAGRSTLQVVATDQELVAST
ncbi:MAG TPA: CapA family protein [Nitriliruptorales bacterium]